MKFKLNSSPHLRMHEITKKLFNLNFLSDIQFLVNDKIIYAHSLELMKRSAVFENDLENTFGEKKLIPIADCKYEVFLEFVRFIYTDDCKIDEDNGIDLLKLAIKYQIIMLENLVINSLTSRKSSLQLFNHCIVDKYEIAREQSAERFRYDYNEFLNYEYFLSLHWNSVNEALQFDQIGKRVSEFEIFEALVKWLVNYGKHYDISLPELQERFSGLIRNIRFPIMQNREIRDCVQKYPELLTERDCTSISKQVLFGNTGVNDVWPSTKRGDYEFPAEWRTFDIGTIFKTKFTVAQDIILHGLRIGKETRKRQIEIQIIARDVKANKIDTISFMQSAPELWGVMVISLGGSIRLTPTFEYTITAKFLDIIDGKLEVFCRKYNVDLKYNGPENCIRILEASENMFELLFKSIVIANG